MSLAQDATNSKELHQALRIPFTPDACAEMQATAAVRLGTRAFRSGLTRHTCWSKALPADSKTGEDELFAKCFGAKRV